MPITLMTMQETMPYISHFYKPSTMFTTRNTFEHCENIPFLIFFILTFLFHQLRPIIIPAFGTHHIAYIFTIRANGIIEIHALRPLDLIRRIIYQIRAANSALVWYFRKLHK